MECKSNLELIWMKVLSDSWNSLCLVTLLLTDIKNIFIWMRVDKSSTRQQHKDKEDETSNLSQTFGPQKKTFFNSISYVNSNDIPRMWMNLLKRRLSEIFLHHQISKLKTPVIKFYIYIWYQFLHFLSQRKCGKFKV